MCRSVCLKSVLWQNGWEILKNLKVSEIAALGKCQGKILRENCLLLTSSLPSVLWHCWLDIRKSIWPVKNFSDKMLAGLSVWSEVLMISIWFSWCHCHPSYRASLKSRMVYLSGAGYPGCPGKEAVKQDYGTSSSSSNSSSSLELH